MERKRANAQTEKKTRTKCIIIVIVSFWKKKKYNQGNNTVILFPPLLPELSSLHYCVYNVVSGSKLIKFFSPLPSLSQLPGNVPLNPSLAFLSQKSWRGSDIKGHIKSQKDYSYVCVNVINSRLIFLRRNNIQSQLFMGNAVLLLLITCLDFFLLLPKSFFPLRVVSSLSWLRMARLVFRAFNRRREG